MHRESPARTPAEHMSQTIAAAESRAFRRLRLVWLGLFIAAVAALFVAETLPWLFMVIAVAYLMVGINVLFWPCPRCGRFYSMRFGLISVAWPYTNHCLHCDSRLLRDSEPTGEPPNPL